MIKIQAECSNHSDRPAKVKGLCSACYQTEWRRKNRYNQTKSYLRWRAKRATQDPLFIRRMSLYQHHRMTLEEFLEQASRQGFRCAICEIGPLPINEMHVDHDHGDARTRRGLLCGRCNRGVGMFDDDPGKLEAAAAYLRRYKLIS